MEEMQPAGSFQNKRRTPFTMLANAMLRNPQLSLKAKGLLGLMLSFPDDWRYHMKHLETLSSDGKDAHSSAIKELIDFGYITRQPRRNERGQRVGYDYEVSDEGWEAPPIVSPARIGFSGAGKTSAGKSATTNTEVTNTDKTKKKDGAASRTKQAAPSQQDRATASGGRQRTTATALETVPPPDVVIPASLFALTGFGEAWEQWLTYRRARRLSCLPMTLQKQLERLARESEPLAVISYTIEQGYQGLVAPKPVATKRPQTTADANARARDTAAQVYRAITEEPDNVPF